VGCDDDEASLVASSLVHADLRGIGSHGLLRLPLYVESVEAGGIVPGAPMQWMGRTGAVARLDAASGFGQTAVRVASDELCRTLPSAGIAAVAIRGSTHYGAGSYWVERIAHEGFLALLTSNSGPCLAPYGGADPILGANPLSIAVPSANGDPVILDMSTTEVAYGRIALAHAEGREIPSTWALDRDGRATTNARSALMGALSSFGGHKGSGLAVVIELLSVALSGATFSAAVTDIFVDRSSQMGTGHLLIGIDPAAFGVGDDFASRVAELGTTVRASRPAEGFDAVLMPGDRELHQQRRGILEGIELPQSVEARFVALADRFGVAVER
jgi:L-2-hydroxycarboxylate dehydrogenase (NAD+)